VKSMLKTVIKKVEQAVAAKNTALAKESLTAAMKALDKAASRGIIHKNLASRKVSRLSARVSKTGAA
ncbi:MAG TPA: 30S ribosomal protein S20, partial [Nitrospiraceae bacterium]|nr:30S ribosomal protein S20 [Nitrospiraceae bacterium]